MSGLDLSLVLSYVSVTFLLVITPGATTAVVIRSALAAAREAASPPRPARRSPTPRTPWRRASD